MAFDPFDALGIDCLEHHTLNDLTAAPDRHSLRNQSVFPSGEQVEIKYRPPDGT